MSVKVAKDCAGVTVHRLNPVQQRGPVFYAALPHDSETPKGQGTNGAEAKHRLVSILWDHVVALESPLWEHGQSSNRSAFPVQLVSGLLGRPHLLLGEYRGPAVSFSEGGGKVWGALCGDASDIGIDVAGTDEFTSDYPLHRVFHPEELHHAVRLAGGEVEEAAALLWSIKEAVVKALGCAFHLVDPRQITVYPSIGKGGGGYTFPVGLSGKALERFPRAAGQSLWVRSLPQGTLWLSIALLKLKPTGNE